jgi:hypothetical protein
MPITVEQVRVSKAKCVLRADGAASLSIYECEDFPLISFMDVDAPAGIKLPKGVVAGRTWMYDSGAFSTLEEVVATYNANEGQPREAESSPVAQGDLFGGSVA